MSTDTGGRAVLKPAGNVARSSLRKTSKLPLKLSSERSLPNSLLLTPKPPARTPPLKPNSTPTKLPPHMPSSAFPGSLPHRYHQEPPFTTLHLENGGSTPAAEAGDLRPEASESPCLTSGSPVCKQELDGCNPSFVLSDMAIPCDSEPCRSGSSSSRSDLTPNVNENDFLVEGLKGSISFPSFGQELQNGAKSSSDAAHAGDSPTIQKVINPGISSTKSISEVSRRSNVNSKVKSKPCNNASLNKLGSLSFDESSQLSILASKKAAAMQENELRRQKVLEYGRKQGKAGRVAPETPSLQTLNLVEQQRCKFISAQSDLALVDYHDKEWGVPVHDDRVLFELLTLAGFQVEHNWTAILHKRDSYRTIFAGFDPAAVSLYREKHIVSLEGDRSLGLTSAKVGGVVNNARKILQVALEFGSLDEYLWGFVNRQPMINSYCYPKQVPVKTSKAEFISKDLVKRGFRFVGPTIIYSFMQASGMTNDHLVQCFRHRECAELLHSIGFISAGESFNGTTECSKLTSPTCHPNFVLEANMEHPNDSN